MPTYTLYNKDTDEKEDHFFTSWSKRDEFLEENKNYSLTISAPSIVHETGDLIYKHTSNDWKGHLKRIKKASGRNNTINTM